ncbi:YciI family protein [Phytoactinopolyspora halotolerans]|uniref:YCII-related domain-containing protein n=1 Tax=Phytoactinopolyspora halotolerans TaxID=1981512 RepID=A0A6L9S6U7_9ACTN|nr:YciI family protein [Phytoactinopolyspora halotolerans]NEE00491.1 hypothetical protein [Phytoactinopolyspora halotolerans]
MAHTVEFEPTFFVRATYVEDAATKREPYRAEHLDNVARMLSDGRLIVAGALADMSASVLVVRAADADAATAMMEQDVYWRTGVWTNIEVSAYNAATEASVRDGLA